MVVKTTVFWDVTLCGLVYTDVSEESPAIISEYLEEADTLEIP
jgi:hypothetical protein